MHIDVLVTKYIAIEHQEWTNNNNYHPMVGQIVDKDKELVVKEVLASINIFEDIEAAPDSEVFLVGLVLPFHLFLFVPHTPLASAWSWWD